MAPNHHPFAVSDEPLPPRAIEVRWTDANGNTRAIRMLDVDVWSMERSRGISVVSAAGDAMLDGSRRWTLKASALNLEQREAFDRRCEAARAAGFMPREPIHRHEDDVTPAEG